LKIIIITANGGKHENILHFAHSGASLISYPFSKIGHFDAKFIRDLNFKHKPQNYNIVIINVGQKITTS
jgi:hypothetical protein